MNLKKIYDKSPYPIRVAAASLRGAFYRLWRYGWGSEKLVEDVLARDRWSAAQWKTWQENELEQILNLAARYVPYYRDHWDKKRRAGDRSSYAYLENWPLLKKEALRKHPRAFLVDGAKAIFLSEEHTSGTSGKPLRLWRSHTTDQRWYAMYEARVRRWNEVSRKDHWAIIGGQIVVPVQQTRPPFWVWNTALNQLYLSAYHIQAGTAKAYLEALRNYQIVYLLGYPSALSALANMVLEDEYSPPQLKVVITNAEMLLPAQRKMIQEAFNCRVVNTYGLSEIAAAGSECDQGTMHTWPDTGIIEILKIDSQQPVLEGESGRLVCTGLVNLDMPLIRYEVGDMAVRETQIECSCGRSLPTMGEIEGRLDDMLITKDGRFVGRLDSVFKAALPVKEAQIIQESREQIHVRIVPSKGFSADTCQSLTALIRERLGDVKVEVEEVSAVPRDANGKFKAVVSNLKHTSKG